MEIMRLRIMRRVSILASDFFFLPILSNDFKFMAAKLIKEPRYEKK